MKAPTQTLPQHDAEILLEITPAHYCKTSETGEFLWLSSGWLELLGYPIPELLGRPFTDFVHPGDLERTYEAMGQLDKGQAVAGFCNRYRSADGSYVSLRWYVKALNGEYFATATETGEEDSQNTLLNESLHLLEFAEELGEIGYWRVDLVQETLFWSQQVYRIHGLDPATYTPDMKTAIDAYHPEDRAAVQAHVETAIAERGAFDFALRIIRADGELRHIVSKGRTECNRDGQVVSLIGISHDVTEWKQLQRRIQQAERLHSVSTLAAGVAHEINNPLQYVMASVALALEQVDSGVVTGNSIRDLLVDTQHGVEQVARIVRQLRSFVTDGTEKEPEPVDLLAVLSTALSMTRSEVRHRAQLSEHLAELPRVMARSSELVQIFVNLITNAVHAIRSLPPTEALIRVRAFRRTDGWAVVEIEDNGVGIPKVDFVRVFEPFYTTKEVGEGTGLGLHVSRNIVQRYGGTIGVVSRPGKTCFKVAFPPVVDESEPERERKLPVVLIVDDQVRVAQATGRLLRAQYLVVLEHSPESALSRIRSGEHFDLLLCDIQMPGMTGWDFLDVLRQDEHPLANRTVLMSGAIGDTSRPPHLAHLTVLNKPFGPALVRDALAAALDR